MVPRYGTIMLRLSFCGSMSGDTDRLMYGLEWRIVYTLPRVPEGKIHGDNMGPIWGRQDPGGPHVGPMNFAIWGVIHDCGVYLRYS